MQIVKLTELSSFKLKLLETKQCVNLPGSYTCQDKIEIDPYMTLASSRSSQTTSSRTALRTIAANDKKKVRLDKLIERLVINPESRCATKNIELSEIVRTDRHVVSRRF